ncbi:lipocalin-like domain-containing protein [Agrobacterium larrymoorei]|uniref:Lipocalin-like domain-containing protein n=1 Tax=Agrobacterium larrymoorei TaxID=160699 RepID=A0A4D7DRC9_9HYPH|nr:lipocalin-like domain-containing protein [Agrobacterium larrymoorei]QCI98247.1 lipocalin-like domain-containing protein [Agrobacterium larrymoorei]QYA06300.1 lipocalin-like domain-containing protein [Agrobacterium larrymoorei]WHA40317.1 lipocalin-like domain-containing protein [Agrobacterium larrymoorei]
MKTRFLTVAALFLAASATGRAQAEDASLTGSWRLVSYEVESQDTGKKIPAMGDHPTGRVIFTDDHRVAFVLTGEGRKSGAGDADKAALLNTLVAYTGTEETKNDEWCTHVEAAWNPEWVGTTQCRKFRRTGDRLEVLTPWRQMPNWPGTTRSIVTFERDK